MAAKHASLKRVSRSLAMTVTKLKHIDLKVFYCRRKEEILESNVELFEAFVLTAQADRRVGLCVWRFKSKVKPKPKQLVT